MDPIKLGSQNNDKAFTFQSEREWKSADSHNKTSSNEQIMGNPSPGACYIYDYTCTVNHCAH